jgi:sugar lactone lactonase YvrE
VHHGSRESIEVFDVDAGVQPPALTWTGCIVGPENGTFNAVVALPEGGVAATTVTRTSDGGNAGGNGAVWEWHLRRGWTVVPGSEADRINGLEISADGKALYISAWGDQALIRLERGTPAKRELVKVPFRIDNLRLMSDGTLLAAGHGGNALCSCPEETWHIGRIEPRALTVQELLRRPYDKAFGAATVAVAVGKEIWIGTNRGDRIGRFPATSQAR